MMITEHDHKGHRARMKQRFLQDDLDHFDQHQMLELLLFYAIPQRDTNPLAHTLIKQFGSLSGVLEAPYEELVQIDGLKESSAILLKLIPSLSRQYRLDKNRIREPYDTLEKIGNYAKDLYIGVTVERAYALLFDNGMCLKETMLLAEGSVNSVPIQAARVVERALRQKASSVVLVHNHPDGLPIASREDIAVTHEMEAACHVLGINLLEHLVVAGDDFMPILRHQKGFARTSPMTGETDPSFYRDFYREVE